MLFDVYVLILYSINMKYFVPSIICWYIQKYIINISEYYNWFCCVFFIMVNDVINDICYNGCDILLCVMVIKDVKIDGYDIYVYIKVILNIYINGWCLCVDIIWYY